MKTEPECWQTLEHAGMYPSNRFTSPRAPAQAVSPGKRSNRFILWIDGVGGYLLIDRDEVLLGQAIADSRADIPIVGDLSRQAAVVRRAGSDYLIQALQTPCLVRGRVVESPLLLGHEDIIQLGQNVRLRFVKPHPLSATARLDLLSLSRFQPRVDAVLLAADSCLLGSQPSCHVVCPHWTNEVLLVKRDQGWAFNLQEELEVNGKMQSGPIAVKPGLRICGSNFSLSIE